MWGGACPPLPYASQASVAIATLPFAATCSGLGNPWIRPDL